MDKTQINGKNYKLLMGGWTKTETMQIINVTQNG